MSHYVAVVLVPPIVPKEHVEEVVARMLAPFDDNVEVPEHEQRCWCVDLQARIEALQSAEAQYPIDSIREEFAKLPDTEQTDIRWRDLSAARVAAIQTALDQHPLKDQPNPDCETCRGSGKHQSTANVQGKLDFWRVGGRWDGWLFGPERQAESSDQKSGHNFGPEHQSLGNNSRPVREIPLDDPYYLPFAVLTPDGQWHEMGQMGSFAMVSDEKPPQEWHQIVRDLYGKYPDHVAVTVDCHT